MKFNWPVFFFVVPPPPPALFVFMVSSMNRTVKDSCSFVCLRFVLPSVLAKSKIYVRSLFYDLFIGILSLLLGLLSSFKGAVRTTSLHDARYMN